MRFIKELSLQSPSEASREGTEPILIMDAKSHCIFPYPTAIAMSLAAKPAAAGAGEGRRTVAVTDKGARCQLIKEKRQRRPRKIQRTSTVRLERNAGDSLEL